MERKIGLDIMRAAAILIVVMGHSSILLEKTALKDFPFFKPVDGVDLFFVLSGFLIGGIILREFNKSDGLFTLFTFWKRRWFRTLPLYFLILGLNYLVVQNGWIKGDIRQANWSFVFFMQNLYEPFVDFFWESWSLSVEEWFYVTSPILFLFFLKFLSKKIAFLLTIILMIASSILFRYTHINPNMDSFFFDITFKKVVLMRLDSIAFGLLFAWGCAYYRDLFLRFKYMLLLIAILILYYHRTIDLDVTSSFAQVIYLTLSPMALSLTIPFFYSIELRKNLFTQFATFISKISYSMYLINLALVIEFIHLNYTSINGIIQYLLAWFCIVFASYLLYYYFEKPIMNLRDKKFISKN
ncbi:MAG: acyltransferase family protein [Bacteroidota bacterium]